MTHTSPGATGDPYRYGIYLRPDPHTCWAVTTITAQLRAQYGFVSAAAFPPHATLVGSQHLGRNEEAIVDAVSAALAGRTSFDVHNSGIRPQKIGFVYDIHHLEDGVTANLEMLELAVAVDGAVTPLRIPAADPAPNTFERATYRAHLSLASHDLYARADLSAEVHDYLLALPIEVPKSFTANTVTLYRTRSDDWSGRWWRTLECEHLHSWQLAGPRHAITSEHNPKKLRS